MLKRGLLSPVGRSWPRWRFSSSRAGCRSVGHEGLSDRQLVAGFPQVVALFTTGGEVTANPGEDPCPLQGAEATRDLLLDLDHADILFPLVVGQRHGRVEQEREPAQVIVCQAIQEVGRFALLGAALPLSASQAS